MEDQEYIRIPLVCERCGVSEHEDCSVEETIDPYQFEMNGGEYHIVVCAECYNDMCGCI